MNDTHSDALVFFGATGDLAHKKIFPALENLERRQRLPPIVVGVARGDMTREALLERMRESLARNDNSTDPAALDARGGGGHRAGVRRRRPSRPTGTMRLTPDRRTITLPVVGALRSKENTRRLERLVAAGKARILSDTLSERTAGSCTCAERPATSSRAGWRAPTAKP